MGVKDKLLEANSKNPLMKAKLFYLFFESIMRSLPQYLGLYYKHTLLLSPHQVAILLSIRPFLLIFGSPFLGSLADKTNKFRLILIISLVTFLSTYVVVPLVEPVEGFNCKEHIHNKTLLKLNRNITTLVNPLKKLIAANNQNRMHIKVHKYYSNVDRDRKYSGKLMEDLYYTWPLETYEYEKTDDITSKVFTTLLIITIVGEFFASPAETFADLYTLQALGSERDYFGWQILPGLCGWFVISMSFAIVTNVKLTLKDDFCHVGHIINYSPYLFVVYGLTVLCILIAIMFTYRKNPPKGTAAENSCGCNFIKALPVLAEKPSYTAYTIAVIFCGFGCGVKQLYIYHYITELGGPDQLLLIVITVHFVSGLIALVLSPKLLQRFNSSNIIAAGLLCNGISFVIYSVIKNPWLILLAEPLQGICDQLSWVAIVTYAGAPPVIGASLQGAVHGLHRGLGIALGYYVISVLILKYGYVSLFLALGLLFFVVFGFYVFVINTYPKKESIAEDYGAYTMLAQEDVNDDYDYELTNKSNAAGYEKETLDKSFLD